MITDQLLKKAIDAAERAGGMSINGMMLLFDIERAHAAKLMDVLESEGVVEFFDGDPFHKFLCRGNVLWIDEMVETPNQTLWATFFSDWQKFDLKQRADGVERLTDLFTFAVNNFKGPERK